MSPLGELLYFSLDTCYFEPVTEELSDWMPSHEHFLRSKPEAVHAVTRADGPNRNPTETQPRWSGEMGSPWKVQWDGE